MHLINGPIKDVQFKVGIMESHSINIMEELLLHFGMKIISLKFGISLLLLCLVILQEINLILVLGDNLWLLSN
jgi:hypothetical protein